MLYGKCPELFHARLDDPIHAVFDNNGEHLTSLSPLFHTIIEKHSELITLAQVDYLFTSIKNYIGKHRDASCDFQALGHVAKAQLHLFDKHREELVYFIMKEESLLALYC